MKRGLFACEAGLGSSPNIAGAATVAHPVEQGLIQSLAVFIDTMVICTATAFIVLASAPELYNPAHPGAIAGASLTEQAIAADLGSWSTVLMTSVVFFFAFSSVLSNYVIAEANLFFLGGRRWAINMLKLVTLGSIAFGAMSKLTLVWSLADLAMAMMAIANLISICLLGKWAFAAIRDYHHQAARGRHPGLHRQRGRPARCSARRHLGDPGTPPGRRVARVAADRSGASPCRQDLPRAGGVAVASVRRPRAPAGGNTLGRYARRSGAADMGRRGSDLASRPGLRDGHRGARRSIRVVLPARPNASNRSDRCRRAVSVSASRCGRWPR